MAGRSESVLPQTWNEEYYPSLAALLSNIPAFCKAVRDLPDELVNTRPRDLENAIRKMNGGTFDRTLGFLKIRFWEEYRHCMDEKKSMKLDDIIYGICSYPWFAKHVLKNETFLAWLVQPPVDVSVYQQEIRNKALAKISDALEHPIFEVTFEVKHLKDGTKKTVKKKKVNVPFLKEIHSILKTMQDRVDGSVIQRAQIHTHTTTSPPSVVPGSLSDPNLTLDDLMKFKSQLSKIQGQLEAATPAIVQGGDDDGGETEDSEESEA